MHAAEPPVGDIVSGIGGFCWQGQNQSKIFTAGHPFCDAPTF